MSADSNRARATVNALPTRVVHASIVLAVVATLAACTALPFGAIASDPRSAYDGTDRTARVALFEHKEAVNELMELIEPTELTAPLPSEWRHHSAGPCVGESLSILVRNSSGGLLHPAADPEEILERIAAHFDRRDGWTVKRSMDDTTDKLNLVEVKQANGMRVAIYVDEVGPDEWLKVAGFTACFSAPRSSGVDLR